MAEPEEWSWRRWAGGFASGRRYGKDFAILLRLLILVTVICLVAIGIWKVKQLLIGDQVKAQAHNSASPIRDNSGTIHQKDNHSTNTVVHNHSPLENGILGLIFGSKDHVVKEIRED